MGVPTMYAKLLATFDAMPPERQARAAAAAAGLRLTVSGSSSCPVPIMHRWRQLTGQYLLERCVCASVCAVLCMCLFLCALFV
jgi:malonyl-CoA/methylmalonyl-CoA synthetase